MRRAASVAAAVVGLAVAGCGGHGSRSHSRGSAGSDRHRNRVARNRRAFDARYRTPVVVASCLLFPANLAFDACGGLFPAHSSPDGVAVKGNIAFVAENGSAFVQNPTATSFGSICVPVGRTSSGALRSSTTRSASRSVRTETSTSLTRAARSCGSSCNPFGLDAVS